MARLDLRGRILLAIGAGTVFAAACGGAGTSGSASGGGSSPTDAGPEDAYDAASDEGDPEDAGPEDAHDAADDALDATSADGDGQACTPVGGPCTQAGNCCPGAYCITMQCAPTIRRPFLVGSSLRIAGAVERSDW